MRSPASLRTVLWRVGAAAAFVTALSFAPIRATPFRFTAQSTAPQVQRGAVAADLATLLPERPIAVLEGHGLGALARGFLTSDLHARLVGMETFRKIEKTPEYAQMLAGLSFAQLASGLKPTDLAGALLGDAIVGAFVVDGAAPGLVVAVRIGDADVAEQLVRAARSFALMNKEAAVKPRDFDHHAGTGVVIDDKLWLASVGGDLVAASSETLVDAAIDRDVVVAGSAEAALPMLVQRMRHAASGDAKLCVALDLPAAAALKPDHALLPAKSDNLVGGLLFGDLLAAFRQADVAVAELHLDGARARIAIRVPETPQGQSESLRSFGHARAQAPLLSIAPRNTLATLSLRRDLSQYWDDRAALCDEKTEKDFAGLKTGLGPFFSGRSLPDEILPQLDDEILFVLARQSYPAAKEQPKVRLPAGALVFKTKGDGAKLGQQFGVAIHSLVVILNIDAANNKQRQTPLVPFVEPFEGATVYGGRPLADDDAPADMVRQNVAPAATWVGDRVIVASSEELLHDLVRILKSDPAALAKTSSLARGCTGSIRLDGGAIAQILRENRDALVSNAVLKEGKPREKAELENDALAEFAALVADGRIEENVMKEALEFALEVNLAPLAPVAPTTPAAAPVAAPAAAARSEGS